MSIKKEEKKKLIEKYSASKDDTGSPEVQVALLSKRIQSLSEHLKTHKKDNSSRRGLLRMVGKRRKLLTYLKNKKQDKYLKLIKSLNLKK